MKTTKKIVILAISLTLLASCAITSSRYAVNMNDPLTYIKVNFLKENYDEVIRYSNKLGVSQDRKDRKDILYYLGVSQLAKQRFRDARRTFELLKQQDTTGKYRDVADIRLADSYFLEKKYHQALQHYSKLPSRYPDSDYLPYIYYRLVLASQKVGQFNQSKRYFDILNKDYPESLESLRLSSVLDPMDFEGYSVQVGSFSNPNSARKRQTTLLQKGYIASIRKVTMANHEKYYRVRINCHTRGEAERIAARLRTEGYVTKVYP